jgi:hypothetical protein
MARIAMSMRPSGFGSLMTVIRTRVSPFPTMHPLATLHRMTQVGNKAPERGDIEAEG